MTLRTAVFASIAFALIVAACGGGEPNTSDPSALGKIAFDSDRDGNSEIYVVSADGSGLTNLTNHPASDNFLAWSPDGSRILFLSDASDRDDTYVNGNKHAYVMNSDGSDKTRLASNGFAAWSPDGTYIAFGSGGHVSVIEADGSAHSQIVDDVPGSVNNFAWSADGSRIAFATSSPEGLADVYVMSPDASSQSQIVDDLPGSVEDLVWSPDGSRIAFANGSVPVGVTEVYVMDADGSGLVNLTDNPSECGYFGFRCFDWSPDGERIVVESDTAHVLYLMNADGSDKARIAHGGFPVWSPDGTRIAFVCDREICVVDVDGSGQSNFPYSQRTGSGPVWSPDGTRIAFVCNGEICVMNADGSGLTNLTNDPGNDGGLFIAWSPVQ